MPLFAQIVLPSPHPFPLRDVDRRKNRDHAALFPVCWADQSGAEEASHPTGSRFV